MTSDPEVTQLRMFLDKLPSAPCDIKRPEEFCSICKKVNSQVYYECQKARRSKGLIIDSETQEKEYDIDELIKKVDEKIKGIPDKGTKFEVVKDKEDEEVTTLEIDDPDRPMIEIIRPNYKKPDEAKFEVVKEEKAPVRFEHEAAPKEEPASASEDDVKDNADKEKEEDLAVFELAEPVKEKPKEKVKFQIAKKEKTKPPEEGFWEGVNVEPVLEEGTVVSGKDAGPAKETKVAGGDEEPLEVVPVEVLEDDEAEGDAEDIGSGEDGEDDGEVIVAQVLEEDEETPEAVGAEDEAKGQEEKPMVEFVKKPETQKDKPGVSSKGEKVKEEPSTPKRSLKKKVKRSEGPQPKPQDEGKPEETEVWVTDASEHSNGAKPNTVGKKAEKADLTRNAPPKQKVKKVKKA